MADKDKNQNLIESITKYLSVREAMGEELAETFAIDSVEFLLGYCDIDEIPSRMNVVARSLANKLVNRYQIEGFQNYSEGGISVAMEDLLTREEKTIVNRYKKAIR